MNGSQYLQHYGIPKMRWGVRRFQNEDGSLTEEGKKRYGKSDNKRSGEGARLFRKKAAKSEPEKVPEEPPKPLTNDEIVKSGDAKLVLANADRLSTQELQAARTRLNELSAIRNMTMGEVRQKKEHVIKRGAKLIGKAIADQTADSTTKVVKGVTSYGIKKGLNWALPDNEWKTVIISSLNNSGKKKKKKEEDDE